MKRHSHISVLADETGALSVIVIMILALLTIVGLATINTTTTEVQIAANEQFHKTAFYAAEGGAASGIEIVEQNICCPAGFTATGTAVTDYNYYYSGALIQATGEAVNVARIGDMEIKAISAGLPELTMWRNDYEDVFDPANVNDPPSPSLANRDVYFPQANGSDSPTNLRIGGKVELSTGAALQISAGYEGKGKGAAGGGGILLYAIRSKHERAMGRGRGISETILDWRHLIGQEDICVY
jgi:hypothetical protein